MRKTLSIVFLMGLPLAVQSKAQTVVATTQVQCILPPTTPVGTILVVVAVKDTGTSAVATKCFQVSPSQFSVDNSTNPPSLKFIGAINNGTPTQWVIGEAVNGAADGTNTNFSVANTPTTLSLYVNGVRQRSGTDYSVNANKILFTSVSVPPQGSTILADYQR